MKLCPLIVVVLTIVPLPQRRVALAVAPERCQRQQKKPASMTGFLNPMPSRCSARLPWPALFLPAAPPALSPPAHQLIIQTPSSL